MGANSLLILQVPQLNQRLTSLLTQIHTDPSLSDLYINDPVGVIQKSIFPEETNIPPAEIHRGNRLLFSLLSNKNFLDWAQNYENQLIKQAEAATKLDDPDQALNSYLVTVDRNKIHQDLAAAVAKFADPELIASLTWKGSGTNPADIAVDTETFVYAVAVLAVFAVGVMVLFAGRLPVMMDGAVLTRVDLANVANQLSEQLIAHANTVKASGVLTQFANRNTGYIR